MEILFIIVLGIGLLLLDSPNGNGVPKGDASRVAALTARASEGKAWNDAIVMELNRVGLIAFSDRLAPAICRWIGIESGGDVTSKGNANERGILQADHETFIKAGFTEDDWAKLNQTSTPIDEQAHYAVGYIKYLATAATKVAGWSTASMIADPLSVLWLAYLYHALPALVVDMANHNILSSRSSAEKAWSSGAYTPPESLSKYKSNQPSLWDRFGLAAMVIAGG